MDRSFSNVSRETITLPTVGPLCLSKALYRKLIKRVVLRCASAPAQYDFAVRRLSLGNDNYGQ